LNFGLVLDQWERGDNPYRECASEILSELGISL